MWAATGNGEGPLIHRQQGSGTSGQQLQPLRVTDSPNVPGEGPSGDPQRRGQLGHLLGTQAWVTGPAERPLGVRPAEL